MSSSGPYYVGHLVACKVPPDRPDLRFRMQPETVDPDHVPFRLSDNAFKLAEKCLGSLKRIGTQ